MIDIVKEINTIAGDLAVKYDNPLIHEFIKRAYNYGVNDFKNKVISYLENKVVISKSDVVDMFTELSESINDMCDTKEVYGYNEGIETAQDIVHKYLHP